MDTDRDDAQDLGQGSASHFFQDSLCFIGSVWLRLSLGKCLNLDMF